MRFGRRKTLSQEQTEMLQKRREQGELIKNLMNEYRLSKVSAYRYLVLDEKEAILK